MLKLQNKRIPLVAGAVSIVLVLGVSLFALKVGTPPNSKGQSQGQVLPTNNSKNHVLQLVSLSPPARAAQLAAMAQEPQSPNRVRARYLLASDLIQENQGKKALPYLEGLEQDYPLLAPYIALKRAQAATASNQSPWQELLKRYPKEPVAVEALFVLGSTKHQYWEQAIAQFPAHPRSLAIMRTLLKANPKEPKLLLLLARYAYDQPDIIPVLDELVSQSSTSLKPENWEVIAFGYWQNRVYVKAATAYAKSHPHTPLNFYRMALGFQLGGQQAEAIAAYQQLIHNFPKAKETGLALLKLAKITHNSQEALAYLDKTINQFPQQAGAALVRKAALLDALHSQNSAQAATQLLLAKYGDSEAAAEYRWQQALTKAVAQDYRGAWQWAQPIPRQNPRSILAPRASFWIAKWANQLGRKNDAKAAFEFVLAEYPQSYYAWRSAAVLGLDVANFNTVRQVEPQILQPERTVLPVGSPTLKELYLLGQDQDASALWQTEFKNHMQPTVAEQFTDGLLRLAQGENLVGIDEISTLEDRETPQEQAAYQTLSQQSSYWQARYPLPFLTEIVTWSKQRHLNPLLVSALIRQESRFEPKIRSQAGAVGLMQVLPATAQWVAGKIQLKSYNLANPSDNIQLGTYFLDYTHQQYNNNSLLAVASYNAGPGNVSRWLHVLGKSDPDEFIEAIPFDETRNYVRQVFGNYWNYLRLYNPEISQLVAKSSTHHSIPSP